MKYNIQRILGCDDQKLRRRSRSYGIVSILFGVSFFIFAAVTLLSIKQAEAKIIDGTNGIISQLEDSLQQTEINDHSISLAIKALENYRDHRPSNAITPLCALSGLLFLYMGFIFLKLNELYKRIPNQGMDPTESGSNF